MQKYIRFMIDNVIRKPSDFFTKDRDLNNLSFSKDSILHFLDNIELSQTEIIDKFNFQRYNFLNNNIEKYLYSNYKISNLYKNYIDNPKIHIRMITSNLELNLQNFKAEIVKNISKLKYEKNLSSFIRKINNNPNILGLINHNPLFRISILNTSNKYKLLYKIYIIYFNILEFISSNLMNKNNFIMIPIDNINILSKNIIDLILKLDNIPDNYINYIDTISYLLIHILLYSTNEKSKFTIFNKLKLDISKINFVFYNQYTYKCIIYNLDLLKKLIKNNTFNKYNFLTSIYTLSKASSSTKIINNFNKNIINIKEKPIITKTSISISKEPIEIANDTNIKFKSNKKSFKDDIKDSSLDFINNNINLTPAQKQKFKKYIDKSLNLKVKINNKEVSIGDIINKKINTNIENTIDVTHKIDPLVMDPSYAKSNIINFNNEYMEKHFYQDMFKTILSFAKVGLILTNYKEEDIKTDINIYKKIHFTVINTDGIRQTLSCEIPIPDKDGYFRYNGVKSIMKKQLVNIPIVKINTYTVSISSNFGKIIVERNISNRYNYGHTILQYINNYNKQHTSDPIKYTKQYMLYNDIKVPYDYSSIGKNIKTITSKTSKLIFNYINRFSNILSNYKEDYLKTIENKYNSIYIGYNLNTKNPLFINFKNIVQEIDYKSKEIISTSFLIDTIIPNNEITVKPEYIKLYILNKKIPLILVLAYKYGLSNILEYLNVSYRLVEKTNRLHLKSNEIPIKFKNKTLIISRYPLTKSWIIAGLLEFNILNTLDFEDMDMRDTYLTLLDSKGLALNYSKGIDNLYNFFIDPLTADILELYNEPTNIRDLLIRAVEMLNTNYHNPASSKKNYRIKSLDRINGILYNEIARQYAQYLNDKSKNTAVSINTKAVLMKILQDQSVVLAEEINPIQYIKERTALTHGGFLGRDSSSFVRRDIAFPEDGLGLLSEAVPDSSKVGFNAYTPLNTIIKNTKGIIDQDIDQSKLKGGQILSVTGELLPFLDNDDMKRVNFVNIQLTHHVPSEYGEPLRIRTGLESLIGDYSGDLYAVIAKKDGKIIEINNKDKYIKFKYNDEDKIYLVKYGKLLGNVSSLSIVHNLKLNIDKIGSFKKDDVLIYNTGFFTYDPVMNQLNWNHGVLANIALIDKDNTLEDSSAITNKFLNKTKFHVNHKRVIKIDNNLIIKDMVSINDKVDYNTPLISLAYEDVANIIDENEEDVVFEALNKKYYISKYKGIIHDIKFYYTSDLDTYNVSIQNYLKSYINKINKFKKTNKNIENSEDVNIQVKVTPGTRIKKESIEKDEVIIIFYITSEIDASIGDKFVIDGALKTVVGEPIDYDIITKEGINIDAIFGKNSIFDRIVLSPFKVGILERILEKIESTAIELYNGE